MSAVRSDRIQQRERGDIAQAQRATALRTEAEGGERPGERNLGRVIRAEQDFDEGDAALGQGGRLRRRRQFGVVCLRRGANALNQAYRTDRRIPCRTADFCSRRGSDPGALVAPIISSALSVIRVAHRRADALDTPKPAQRLQQVLVPPSARSGCKLLQLQRWRSHNNLRRKGNELAPCSGARSQCKNDIARRDHRRPQRRRRTGADRRGR